MITLFTNIKTGLLIFTSVLLLSACGTKAEETEFTDTENEHDFALDSQKISAQNVFNAIPGRTEIINLTQQAQAEYNSMALNDPNNVNSYLLESSKALNLGVYGSDLNVTGVFEQTQESMLFLKCVNMLAKSLGVSNSFDEKMVDRMTTNQSNRDSTLEIISQSFRSADTYLKANGRPGTSSLIVAGAWIEGIYMACNTAKETKNENVVKEIFTQKESLKYLVELLEVSKISADAQCIITDLKDMKKVFDAKTDKVFKIESLKELDSKATALRTKVISAK